MSSGSATAAAPSVLARIVGLIVHAAQARGVGAAELLAGSGVDPADLADADARIPLATEELLWARAAELSGDACFGLHAAALIRPGAFDVMDYAVRTAPTLREALERLARYNRLVHDVAAFHIVDAGATVRVEHGFVSPGHRPCRQASEFTLASLPVVAAQIAGGRALPALAVEFAHTAPAELAPYREVFGLVPRFGAEVSAISFDAARLREPVPGADPGLSRIVTAHAERLLAEQAPPQPGLADQVKRFIAESLDQGPPSLRQVAHRLHLSERSLQRRLGEEGCRFAELVEQVRRELALRYIADRKLALGEVAYLLGFAEPSPFHRAFKRWTGMTPAAARRQQAQPGS
ncbi:MAG: AraC family transcriptional regulator [Burkholderiaceae bacterium]